MFALEHMDHRLKELRFLLRLLQLHLQLLDALPAPGQAFLIFLTLRPGLEQTFPECQRFAEGAFRFLLSARELKASSETAS